jgi:hypothetical protein
MTGLKSEAPAGGTLRLAKWRHVHTSTYTRPNLYPLQRAFVDSAKRYAVVEASTKTGKTVACLLWIFEQALNGKPGRQYWWVAPTYQVAGIAHRRLCAWLNDSGLPRDAWTERKADQAVDIAGRTIWFKGSDKADSLYGEDVWAAVIDEATRCSENAFYAVRTTLTATQGPVKIIGNVRGRRNWAYQLARKAESGDPAMSYHKLTAYDAVTAGVLQAEEVADAKRQLPEAVFRELYLAEPSDDGGNPFGHNAIQTCIAPISQAAPVVYGCDLAKSSDYSVLIGLDSQSAVCYFDRWQGDWGGTRGKILGAVGDTPTLIDSTGVGDPIVEDLQRVRPNVTGFKFTSLSKQQIMEGLASAIQRQDITFPDGVIVNELEAFEYEYTRTGVRYSAPSGLHDDAVCALALAVHHRSAYSTPLDVRLIGAGVAESSEERHWRRLP